MDNNEVVTEEVAAVVENTRLEIVLMNIHMY